MKAAFFVLAAFIAPSIAAASSVATDEINVSTFSGMSGPIAITTNIVINSNHSLLLMGAGGVVITESSVTASAFFGDAANLTGISGRLSSTQTFSGAALFTSSFSILSSQRDVILSTGSLSNVHLLSNGLLAFSPELHNSSATVIPYATTTSTSFGTCVAGSTLTINTTGGSIEIVFNGNIYDGQGGASFLQDGAFLQGFSSITSITSEYFTFSEPGTFRYLTPEPTPGSHSYCLTIACATPCAGFPVQLLQDSTITNLFYVQELK